MNAPAGIACSSGILPRRACAAPNRNKTLQKATRRMLIRRDFWATTWALATSALLFYNTVVLVCGNGHDEDTRTRTHAGANRSTLRRVVVVTGPSSVKRAMTKASSIQVWLLPARRTPIPRHVKVKADANPHDPAFEAYCEKREETHMQDTFRGTRTLRFLWHEQRGLCTVCNTKITRITGWRLHHSVPGVMGGSQSAENRVLLHPECHDRVHRQRIPVSKPRLPERGVRRA